MRRKNYFYHVRRKDTLKNDFIFYEGELGESVYYIQDGELGIFYTTPMGKESLVFRTHAGDMFGLAEAMSGAKRACNARMINACCLYEIQRKDLRKTAFAELDAITACHRDSREPFAVFGRATRKYHVI